MSAQGNAPIIVKRKKVSGGDGHHGGAWKVAYADFVTAMMAFFMLMWLLGATTEKQRKGIADYFNPTIPVVRASGGGSGAFGGDSIFSETTLAQSGTGGGLARPTAERQAKGNLGVDAEETDPEVDAGGEQSTGQAPTANELEELEQALQAVGGESMNSELLRRHIVTRLNEEGLVIELFDTPDAALFDAEDAPTLLLRELVGAIVPVIDLVTNDIAVQAHTRSVP